MSQPDAGDVGDFLAAAWDRHREQLFENVRPLSDWLVDQVDPQPGQTVLELAAGPGETGFLVAERIEPDGKLISTDLSPAMVEAARRGAQARGLTNVEYRVLDAQAIDLPDASVDGVISRFGVMLTPEPDRVASGARRVLRPGGRFAYGVWGSPDRNPWLMMFVGAVLQNGHTPEGDPFGPGGPFSLAEPARNEELLGDAGFADVKAEEITDEMHYDTFDNYWTVQSEVSGPVALLVQSLPDGERDAIRGSLEAMVEPFKSENGYTFPWLAVAASGRS
jgi:ubiquinone/menaquinone biosynthesis C-methylase UbiE